MGASRRARNAAPVPGLACAAGIISIVIAVVAAAVPLLFAFALFRGTVAIELSTLIVGLLGSAIALIGLIGAVIGAIVGKGAQSAAVVVGALMNAGVLVGFCLAVFLPLALQG